MQSMVLQPGAAAARHAVKSLVFMRQPLAHRHHVAKLAVVEADRGQHMVEQRALVEFGKFIIRLQRKQQLRHLHHIIHVARFAGAQVVAAVDPALARAVYFVAQFVGGAKRLVVAVAARRKRVVADHRVPEKFPRFAIRRIAGIDVAHEFAQHLRDIRVAVFAGENVLVVGQRVDDGVVVEPLRELQPARIARVGIEVGQGFIEAAKLRAEHALELRVVEPAHNAFHPSGKFHRSVERRAVARLAVRIAQARKKFMLHIPRRPHAVEVKRACTNGSLGNLLKTDFAIHRVRTGAAPRRIAHQRADVAIALFVLHFLVLVD